MEEEKTYTCPKCKDTGRVMEKDGTIHTCWDCLNAGRLETHITEIKDTKIKI
jgi:ribosomal protein L37AE/L43A